ncbi:MAG TPA: YeeE/YedE thiosulfate transporter family protein [Polyangia bacterium]
MTFPFESLGGAHREVGLVVAVLTGFAFGFVLERAGFGRAQKLVGQFFLTDMTVLKVMFGAIVTAMLGLVVLAGVGLVDLRALGEMAVSPTWLWPMIAGGFLLGVGFIVSGYCPGTSLVAAASGKLDGVATVIGVITGTFIYSEALRLPALAHFHESGNLGNFYLWQWLKLPPAVVALAVAIMAMGMFLGGEQLERIFGRRAGDAAPPRAPRRFAFAAFGAVATLGLLTLARPHASRASARAGAPLTPAALARRVLEAPWTVRVVDLRGRADCAARRVPGAECVPAAELEKLGLKDDPGVRDLVLVADRDLGPLPAAAAGYPGRVLTLGGGFAAWVDYALTKPPVPGPEAGPAERDAYVLRATINAAMTGIKQAPPPPPTAGGAPAKKKAGGGCSG